MVQTERMETMKQRNVLPCTGGGGPLSTGKSSLTDSQPMQLRNRFARLCHPELDSGSIQRDRKNSTLVRFRLGGRNDRIGITHAAFTMADRLSRFHNGLMGSRSAFTMAEILLSLTIIGVVAAITLPSLTGNINERTWNTQRKALYARMSQAIALMPALNGFGTLTEGDSSTSAVDTAAETFITSGLAKVLKINNICDSEHLEDCGIASNINTTGSAVPVPENWSDLNPSMISDSSSNLGSHSMINSNAAAFETANGESIIVYYNSACRGDNFAENESYLIEPYVCANLIYDLNGNKGPNTLGKDIGFMTIFYSSDAKVVAPVLEGATTSGKAISDAQKYCRELDNARLPNREEAMSIAVNKTLLPSITSEAILTSYVWANGLVGHMTMRNYAVFGKITKDNSTKDTQCVKR